MEIGRNRKRIQKEIDRSRKGYGRAGQEGDGRREPAAHRRQTGHRRETCRSIQIKGYTIEIE